MAGGIVVSDSLRRPGRPNAEALAEVQPPVAVEVHPGGGREVLPEAGAEGLGGLREHTGGEPFCRPSAEHDAVNAGFHAAGRETCRLRDFEKQIHPLDGHGFPMPFISADTKSDQTRVQQLLRTPLRFFDRGRPRCVGKSGRLEPSLGRAPHEMEKNIVSRERLAALSTYCADCIQ